MWKRLAIGTISTASFFGGAFLISYGDKQVGNYQRAISANPEREQELEHYASLARAKSNLDRIRSSSDDPTLSDVRKTITERMETFPSDSEDLLVDRAGGDKFPLGITLMSFGALGLLGALEGGMFLYKIPDVFQRKKYPSTVEMLSAPPDQLVHDRLVASQAREEAERYFSTHYRKTPVDEFLEKGEESSQ